MKAEYYIYPSVYCLEPSSALAVNPTMDAIHKLKAMLFMVLHEFSFVRHAPKRAEPIRHNLDLHAKTSTSHSDTCNDSNGGGSRNYKLEANRKQGHQKRHKRDCQKPCGSVGTITVCMTLPGRKKVHDVEFDHTSGLALPPRDKRRNLLEEQVRANLQGMDNDWIDCKHEAFRKGYLSCPRCSSTEAKS